jgi:hypothetical protein
MQRLAMNDLVAWKNRSRRKPLIVHGARQVGKTWLIREFGRTQFERTAYVSFYDNKPLFNVFEGSLNPRRLLDALSLEAGFSIDPATTLLVLDEVQACPRALMALKAFNEELSELAIVAAGSLLGVALHRDISFPVGKVSWLRMYPMTYAEFLRAVGDDGLADLLEQRDFETIDAFRERFVDRLRQYYFVGGMPEAVAAFADSGDYREARTIQEELLADYEHVFSKYAGAVEAERIRMVWRSSPSQLARENRKFLYAAVRPSGRAREFESAIRWLEDAGLVLRVPRVTKPGLPLSSYEDLGSFKLYLLDVGLLGAASGLQASTVLDGNRLFEEFKGSLTEQFVCQQLVAGGLVPWYWSADNSSGEVDFIFEHGGSVVPVEVKAAENLRARSLRAFCSKYGITGAVRLSMSPYRREEWLTNVPLYASGLLPFS